MRGYDIPKILVIVLVIGAAVFLFYKNRNNQQPEAAGGFISSGRVPETQAQPASQEGTASAADNSAVQGSSAAPTEGLTASAASYDSKEMLKALIRAVSGQGTEEIKPENGWETLLTQQEYGVYPPYSKHFRKTGAGLEANLFSYAVPSLTEAKELIMSGELKMFSEMGKPELLSSLKNEGFQVFPTKKYFSGFGSSDRSAFMELQKDRVSGLLYYDSQGGKSYLKIKLEDRDAGLYSEGGLMPKRISNAAGIMPKLIEDAEKSGVPVIIGAGWEGIKAMLSSNTVSVSVEELIAARNAIKANTPEGESGAVFPVLEKFLVDAMFRRINRDFSANIMAGKGGASAPKELELLKANDIGYELQYMGESYSPSKNSLMEIYEKYPRSYWGQYAFITEMEKGFSETKCGLDSASVIKEGERFLAAVPDSAFMTRVLFLMGKANETAYSVGLSADKYSYVCDKTDCAALSKEGEKYRLEAVKYYAEVLKRPDGGEYSEHLSRTLPKLRTGGNTYCVFYVGCTPN